VRDRGIASAQETAQTFSPLTIRHPEQAELVSAQSMDL
jgi:hypothetical protein